MIRFLKILEYFLYVLIGINIVLISSMIYFTFIDEHIKINGITFYCEGNKSYFYTNSEPIISYMFLKDDNSSLILTLRNYKEEKVFINKNICKNN